MNSLAYPFHLSIASSIIWPQVTIFDQLPFNKFYFHYISFISSTNSTVFKLKIDLYD